MLLTYTVLFALLPALTLSQDITYEDCPPAGALDGVDLTPGECIATYVCRDSGPGPKKMIAKNSYEDARALCNSVTISLRCAGAPAVGKETVTYEQFGKVPDKKCDHAIISFGADGKILQRCCALDGGGQVVEKGGEKENGGGKDEKPLRRCDVDPDLPCPDGSKGGQKLGSDEAQHVLGGGGSGGGGGGAAPRRCDVDPDLPC